MSLNAAASPRLTAQMLAAIILATAMLLAGCAANFAPQPMDSVPFLERAETQISGDIRVTAAVPDAKEARALFGLSLYQRGVQPVWIEVANLTDEVVSFLPASIDPDYHSPLEVASLHRSRSSRETVEAYFLSNRVGMSLAPGATRSGFVFTKLDEGSKAFNVDIIGDETAWQFTFFIQVPGLAIDHYDTDFRALYDEDEVVNYADAKEFIAALEALPCCATDAKSQGSGDPLNLVMIGDNLDIYYAVLRAGWDETEAVSAASGFKTAVSFVSGSEYRYSPVSNLYALGRKQDIALQKIRSNINQRNHFRIWLAPITFENEPVWLAQISRDIGVRFTKKTITTHKIDPDVDETREFLFENLVYSQVVKRFAYVGGVGEAPIDAPRGNLTGDPYFTDGLRVVMWLSKDLTAIEDVVYENWVDPNR